MLEKIVSLFCWPVQREAEIFCDALKSIGMILPIVLSQVVYIGLGPCQDSESAFGLTFLLEIEGLGAYDGYKYPAFGMINFLLFVRLCRFKTREEGLEFLVPY